MPARSKASANAILFRLVSKGFDGHAAVDGLSLSLPRGAILGFIGPNGSGKTTSIRMMMNLILPDAGHIEVLGQAGSLAARDRVSYLPEERGLYKKMKVQEVLRYYAELKGVDPRGLDQEIRRWLERFELLAWAGSLVEELSKGMSQKVQFIAALLSKPELLILDEPFSGLDPVNGQVIRSAMLDYQRQGGSILYSTHDMHAAEGLCDRIVMMDRGRKVLDGTLAQIRRAHPHDLIRLRTNRSLRFLRAMPGVLSAQALGPDQVVRLKVEPQHFLKQLLVQGQIHAFERVQASLQEIFLAHTKAPGPSSEAVRGLA